MQYFQFPVSPICLSPSPNVSILVLFWFVSAFIVVFRTKCGIISGFPFVLIVLIHILCVLFFFFQSKRDVERRLEELRDHYERGNAETERKLRRELKKTKALLRDAQAVIETQVSCHVHPIHLSHLPWSLSLSCAAQLVRWCQGYIVSFVFVFSPKSFQRKEAR